MAKLWERIEAFAVHLALRAVDLLLLLPRPRLLYAYLVIWFLEWRHNPYRWPRSFEAVRLASSAGETLQELVYGETPLCTGVYLLGRAGLRRNGHFVDLCAGRGRALLAARWWGARATGVELLTEHVGLVQRSLAVAGVQIMQGDGATSDLSEATHIYLPWTGFSDETCARFARHLQGAPAGVRTIVLDRPLPGEHFPVVSRHTVWCTWGAVPAWVHSHKALPQRIDSSS